MLEIPKIISVDDHVVEPPDLWVERLPSKYKDKGPRVERDRAIFNFEGGVFSYEKGAKDGEECDWWIYDDLIYPFPKLSAAVGFDSLDVTRLLLTRFVQVAGNRRNDWKIWMQTT